MPQHALDAAARQIGQAIGVEKGKAVFQRVLVAQARGEGRDGFGVQAEHVGQVAGQVGLAVGQGFHGRFVFGIERGSLRKGIHFVV